MKIKDIMTPDARCVSPDATLVEAARLMRQLDVGSLPICDRDRLTGIVTDRDIVIRAVSESWDPSQVKVRDIMSPEIFYAFDDQSVEEAAHLMEEHQIRRLPILNREKSLIGILSLGDMAVEAGIRLSGEALREISGSPHAATAGR